MKKEIVENIEAIVGGLATILTVSFTWWKKRQKARQAERFEQALIETAELKIEIAKKLDELKHSIKAPRVLLLKATNGGGLPNGEKPVYVTIYDEHNDSSITNIRDKVQKLPTDTAYNKMLLTILNKGCQFYETRDMEQGMLRTFYQGDGIICSYVQKVGTTLTGFWYLSVAWQEIIKKPPLIEQELRIYANQILNVLKK